MRKCVLMFGLLIIVLVIASKINEADEKISENLAVVHEVQVKRP